MDGSAEGCTNYTVSAELLGLPHWKVAPNNVVLLANFTEAKSGVVETASSRTTVMHQPLKLEFLPHTPKYFKPGMIILQTVQSKLSFYFSHQYAMAPLPGYFLNFSSSSP